MKKFIFCWFFDDYVEWFCDFFVSWIVIWRVVCGVLGLRGRIMGGLDWRVFLGKLLVYWKGMVWGFVECCVVWWSWFVIWMGWVGLWSWIGLRCCCVKWMWFGRSWLLFVSLVMLIMFGIFLLRVIGISCWLFVGGMVRVVWFMIMLVLYVVFGWLMELWWRFFLSKCWMVLFV